MLLCLLVLNDSLGGGVQRTYGQSAVVAVGVRGDDGAFSQKPGLFGESLIGAGALPCFSGRGVDVLVVERFGHHGCLTIDKAAAAATGIAVVTAMTRLAGYGGYVLLNRGGVLGHLGGTLFTFSLLLFCLVPILNHGLGAHAPLRIFIFELREVCGSEKLQLGRSFPLASPSTDSRGGLAWCGGRLSDCRIVQVRNEAMNRQRDVASNTLTRVLSREVSHCGMESSHEALSRGPVRSEG